MVHQTKTLVSLLLGSWAVFSLFYYNTFNIIRSYETLGHHFKRREPAYAPVESNNGTEDYLINTAGCYIPNYINTLKFVEAHDFKANCGVRAVFIEKERNSNNIKFLINGTLMKQQIQSNSYECCYQYVTRSTIAGREDNQVTYSDCTKFRDGTITELKEEVVKVSCTTNPSANAKNRKIYQDAYIILKKIKRNESEIAKPWNVLVLGLDTVSRGRILSAMPTTVRYLNQHGWLDFRAYQKVGYNTFPNLMAFLTGRNTSTSYRRCAPSMGSCNDDLIWRKYQKFGYITAYGEDNLDLPDTFSPYHGFATPPTNHYMKPFFLTGETQRGNLICTQKLPSAIHALNYAAQFVDTYKNDNFLGIFWLNSCSHNTDHLPTLFDTDLSIFFTKLNSTGALRNTFIFFLGDHGIRYGNMRVPVESFYEERLPMLYMWTPLDFRKLHSEAYYNLQVNQKRLVTPYDLHETFRSILQLSSGTDIGQKPDACPECSSLFEMKSDDRTCENAKVDEKWCSCRNLTRVDKREQAAARSIDLAVSHIQNVSKSISTKKCTKCTDFKLKKVLRIHLHVDSIRNTTDYIIAFEMSPGNVAYEASVQVNEKGFSVLKPTQTISKYNPKGSCVVRLFDRPYCVCERLKNCK